ncbi:MULTISPECIES: hypothetical protein [Vibrio]|uniref:Uncharacterized protein n=1 Tax=Vibrio ostreae TaxID=2841925 RepID=A0A975U5M7_9VIBR|nr:MULTISPECIES: hypothetical protein [Vibrio]QXO15625.1 hypothetical protein KNV97_04200 [Vibrio ostreae]WGY45577.1 hypothetical protein J0X00_01640 [Vibrio sp. ABG19]
MQRTLHIGCILLALTGGFFAAQMTDFSQQGHRPADLGDYCTLSTISCQQHNVTMTMADDHVQPLVATLIHIDWPDTAAETLLLSMQGLEMEMGEVRFKLQRNQQGIFTADIVLPVCTAGDMTWLGTLTDGRQTVYPAIRMQR